MADSIRKAAAETGDSDLLDALTVVDSDLRLESAIKNVLSILLSLFSAENASVILLDLRSYDLKSFGSSRGVDGEVIAVPIKCARGYLEWRSANMYPILANDVPSAPDFEQVLSYCPQIRPRNLISVPLFAQGEFFGLIQALDSLNADGFSERDLEKLTILGRHVALTLRNSWLFEEAIRGSREAKSLYHVGVALSASLDLDELLDKILDNLQRVVQCDTAVIYLVDLKDGAIKRVVGRGIPDTEKEQLHLRVGQGITGRVVETGAGVIAADVSKNPDYIPFRPETRSEMAVPLKAGDTIIGAFNIESDKPGAYTEHDLELLTAFASLAAITLERARLYDERMAARRIVDELSIARRIQMTFLPSEDPSVDGFDISGINIPSADVGGDYYDFIPIVDHQLGIAIGDVSGKGIPASLIMAAFRASLKAEIRNNFAIRAILLKVNNLLYESIERDMYVTAIYCVLDSKNRVLTFSNAGHNPPILLRAGGQVEYLKEGGLALGTFPNSAYEERPVSLNSGDMLLFYTDGVTEAKNDQDKEFGIDRLLSVVKESNERRATEIVQAIISNVKNYVSSQTEMDDLTLIVVKTL